MKKLNLSLFTLCLLFSLACDSIQEKNAQNNKGVDILGKTRSCTPMDPAQVCTMVFTAADGFAQDCEKQGNQAIQCGCHDWICIKNNEK